MKKLKIAGAAVVGVLVMVCVTLLFAQANYQGWKDVGGALVTFNKACLEGTAGSGQDVCIARVTAGHIDFQTGTGAANKDVRGTVTLAGNTATVTFNNAYTAAPSCVATDQTTAQLVKVAPTTTNVVISDTVGATDVVAYVCFGN